MNVKVWLMLMAEMPRMSLLGTAAFVEIHLGRPKVTSASSVGSGGW